MKKFIFMLLLIAGFSCYALDEKNIRNKISGSILFREENNIKDIYKLNDDFYLAYISFNDRQLIYFFDGENESCEHPEKSISFSGIKYLKKIGELDAYVGDFTYTETNQVLYIDLHPTMNWNRFVIKGPDFENVPFLIYFPSYQCPGSTLHNDIKRYNGKNKRVNALRYVTFGDIKFCIVNGKRGFIINTIGNIFMESGAYKMNTAENDNSNLVFFYWNKEKQEYVLDGSVTREQIKNAYCPEDYFAYNGLKFSKLDSKLTEAELKKLDKAQLRLMRNAVYARHGRTFKSIDLQSLWECCIWYGKNPEYSDDLLTDTDKYNIELIQKIEEK